MVETKDVLVVDQAEGAHTLLHPARLELLAALDPPCSPVALAAKLGLPRQRVNYHLRELEAQGLIEAVEERRRGSVVERVYGRRAKRYAISGRVLGELRADPRDLVDRFSSAYQVALADRAVDDLGRLEAGAAAAGQRLPTFALESEVSFASPDDRAAFAQELTDAVARLVERYHSDGGRAFRFYLGGYPRPKDDPD